MGPWGNTPDLGVRSPGSALNSLCNPGHGINPIGPLCPHLQINKTTAHRATRFQGAQFCKAMVENKNESKCRVILFCCSGHRQAALILCFPIKINKGVALLPCPPSPAIPLPYLEIGGALGREDGPVLSQEFGEAAVWFLTRNTRPGVSSWVLTLPASHSLGPGVGHVPLFSEPCFLHP